MGVPMPAIFELLYKEFCRARLAEMRKQLLLTGKHPELLQAAEDPSDPDAGTDFSGQDLCDQESADDKEYVDAGEPAADRRAVVEGEDRKNRNGAQAVDIRAITGLR